jgi:hypothetical protein
MRPKAQERGQALVIIALAAIGLFGFSALAIDGSRVFSDRRNAQNAADTAALSAALTKIRGTGNEYVLAAEERAASNGYVSDADSLVEVHLCNDTAITTPCQGIPTSGEPAQMDPANYVQVRIESIIPATFARVVGRQQFKNTVTAVAYSGPVEPEPVARGAALAALKEEGDATLSGNGVVHLEVHNSGVFNNSRNDCGTQINGASGYYWVQTQFQFASGTYCSGAGGNQLNPVTLTNQIKYPPDLDIKTPTITCSGTGSYTDPHQPTVTFSPGNFSGPVNLTAFGNVNFQPGNYCFNQGFSISGTAKVVADNARIKLTNGEFSLNGTSSLTCNNVLFHITQNGTGVRFNGSSRIDCNDVTFFASTGDVSWSGNATVRIFAPKGGEYEGLLIYLPYGNYSDLTITGNSSNELTGSIFAISSDIVIAGNSGTQGLHSQIVGYTVTLEGHSNTIINYVPEEQYWTVNPTAITLTK